jgi:hypothetical protein
MAQCHTCMEILNIECQCTRGEITKPTPKYYEAVIEWPYEGEQ